MSPNANDQVVKTKVTLEGGNYAHWSATMRGVLMARGLLRYVKEGYVPAYEVEGHELTDAAVRIEEMNEEKALGQLVMTLGTAQLQKLGNEATAWSLWGKAKAEYEGLCRLSLDLQLRKIMSLKMGADETVEDYLHRFRAILAALAAAGKSYSDEEQIAFMTYGVHVRFLATVNIIRHLTAPTLEEAETALRVAENVNLQREGDGTGAGLAMVAQQGQRYREGGKETRSCYNCGKPGHLLRDCRSAKVKRDRPDRGERSPASDAAQGNRTVAFSAHEEVEEYAMMVITDEVPTFLERPGSRAVHAVAALMALDEAEQDEYHDLTQDGLPPVFSLSVSPRAARAAMMVAALNEEDMGGYIRLMGKVRRGEGLPFAMGSLMTTYSGMPPTWSTALTQLREKKRLRSAPAAERAMMADAGGLTAMGSDTWIFESGASSHMCRDRSVMVNYREMPGKFGIKVADGKTMNAVGRGEVIFQHEGATVKLYDVLHVPNLHMNLISVHQIGTRGHHVVFDGALCQVLTRKGKTLLAGRKCGNLYVVINGGQKVVAEAFVAADMATWHKRLGHLNHTALKKLAEGRLVEGLNVMSLDDAESLCEECALGKSTRLPFDRQNDREGRRERGDVGADINGALRVPTYNGEKYILVFILYDSDYAVVFKLRKKSDANEAFRQLVAWSESETPDDFRIKRLFTDQGGEFLNDEMAAYCLSKGISQTFSNTKNSEENGIAERFNRTMMAGIRCLMLSCNLSLSFWGDARDLKN
jgi:hypothetical protein